MIPGLDQYKTRPDIPEIYKWNLNLIYSSEKDWEEEFAKIEAAIVAV
jgi:oligoendopeptidase F